MFRIKRDSDKQVFKKNSKTGKSTFDEGYELFKNNRQHHKEKK